MPHHLLDKKSLIVGSICSTLPW